MSNPQKTAITLDKLPCGSSGIVSELLGGQGVLSRLATLGFTPGARLNMVQNFGRGPLIVCIRDARIALGRGEANAITVFEEGPASAEQDTPAACACEEA